VWIRIRGLGIQVFLTILLADRRIRIHTCD
jgi:hypothetical protein